MNIISSRVWRRSSSVMQLESGVSNIIKLVQLQIVADMSVDSQCEDAKGAV